MNQATKQSRQPFSERYAINDENEKYRTQRGMFTIKQMLTSVDTSLLKPTIYKCLCGHYPKYDIKSIDNKTSEVTVKCNGCENKIKRIGSLANALLFWNRQEFVIAHHTKQFLPLFDLSTKPEELSDFANDYTASIKAMLLLPCTRSEGALLRLLRTWSQHTFAVAEYLRQRPNLRGIYYPEGILAKAIVRQLPEEFSLDDFILRFSLTTGRSVKLINRKKACFLLSHFAKTNPKDFKLWTRQLKERSLPAVTWVKDKKKWKVSHTDVFGDSVQIYFTNIMEAIKLKLTYCLSDGKTPWQRSSKKSTTGASDLLSGISQCSRRSSTFLLAKVKDHTGNNEYVKEFVYNDDASRKTSRREANTWRLDKIDRTHKGLVEYYDLSLLGLLDDLPEYNL